MSLSKSLSGWCDLAPGDALVVSVPFNSHTAVFQHQRDLGANLASTLLIWMTLGKFISLMEPRFLICKRGTPEQGWKDHGVHAAFYDPGPYCHLCPPRELTGQL